MEGKIVRAVIRIAALCVIGIYLLVNKDNIYSRALSRDVYQPEKVSTFLAFGCFGIAFSCIPSLLSILFSKALVKYIFRYISVDRDRNLIYLRIEGKSKIVSSHCVTYRSSRCFINKAKAGTSLQKVPAFLSIRLSHPYSTDFSASAMLIFSSLK